MRKFLSILLMVCLVIGTLLCAGCAGISRRGQDEATSRNVENVDTYVQVREERMENLGPVAVEIPEEEEPVLSAIPEEEPLPEPAPEPPESASLETKYGSGYRIQILATREPEKARAFAESARPLFQEKVYVEYLDPYYKVRVGDCLTREEAILLLMRVRRSGFDEAWITATLVVQGIE